MKEDETAGKKEFYHLIEEMGLLQEFEIITEVMEEAFDDEWEDMPELAQNNLILLSMLMLRQNKKKQVK